MICDLVLTSGWGYYLSMVFYPIILMIYNAIIIMMICFKYCYILISITICDLQCYEYRFFKNFGDPIDCVTLLSENYKGLAQMINILADFLITAG